jgi:hypothetical protein
VKPVLRPSEFIGTARHQKTAEQVGLNTYCHEYNGFLQVSREMAWERRWKESESAVRRKQ